MKLQNMAVIFAIVIIPMTLILSAYIGFQIDTASLQQQYDTKLLDATHDAVLAFQLNSIENNYSTNADSLRRDIKASINALFTSLATNIGVPGENSNYISQYIPAVAVTLYDGYYIYSPIEIEYTENGVTKTKYEHALKPYIHYSTRYKTGNCDIVVNYSLDNYITVYGYMNGQYISRGGYLIAGEDQTSDDGSSYRGVEITDETARDYYRAAKNFTYWIKGKITGSTYGGVSIASVVTPENALDSNGNKFPQFTGNNIKILDTSDNNDPEDTESDFTAHKREIMKQSIQSNLNNAIWTYSNHSTLNTDFRMPILTEQDWDKVLSNVNIITFMQGLPVGIKEYNNYAIVTSTKNKQYVDPDLLYYFDKNVTDAEYHKLECPSLTGTLDGRRSIYFDEKNEDGKYKHKNPACYTCLVNSTVNKEIDATTGKVKKIEEYEYNKKQAYYNVLARERWNLNKPSVTQNTNAEVTLDTVKPRVTVTNKTSNSIKFIATDSGTGVVGWTITNSPNEPAKESFTKCGTTSSFEYTIRPLTQNTTYYIWAIDTYGNISEGTSAKTLEVLKSEGNITFELSNNNWTNQDIVVTAKSTTLAYTIQTSKDPSFPLGGTYNNSITVSLNGTIYARLVDDSGQSNGYASIKITKIDKVKPQITGVTATTNQVTITATDDASGIVGYAVTENNTAPSSFTACDITKILGKTITGLSQNKMYYVWVKDQAGNINEVKSFKTGTVIASSGNITFTLTPSGWTNGNVTVTATPNVSGYIVQTSTSTTFPSTATEVRSVTVNSNQTVYARLVDSSNQANGYAAVAVTKIDKQKPEITGASVTTNSVTFTAKDNESGVIGYAITSTNSVPSSFVGCTATASINFTINNLAQNNTYYLWVKDAVGNVSDSKMIKTSAVVASSGNITFTLSPSGWTNGNVTVTATPNVSGYIVQTSTSTTFPSTATEVRSVTVSSNQTVYARLVDSSNQANGYAAVAVTKIDKTAPSIPSVTYNGGANTCAYKNNYNITLSSSDSQSGVAYYEIDWTGDGNANGTTGSNFIPWNNFSSCNTRFRAVDNVGNRSAWTGVHHIHMDTEAPQITTYWWGEVTAVVARLYFRASDNVGINSTTCPVITASGGYGAETPVWDSSANAYRVDISPSNYGHYNQKYTTYIYAYDAAGNSTYIETSVNIPARPILAQNYDYTGSVQTYTVPVTGTYKLEVWGAEGGSYSNDYVGGKGGYSVGNKYLTEGTTLYICVGKQGDNSNTNAYNGGGATYTGGGGGATHIATTNRGELYNYESYKSEVLIVAGGRWRFWLYS